MPPLSATLLGALALAAAAAQQVSNPFCAFAKERNIVSVQLICTSGVIDALPQAYFGTPTGACPAYAPGTCDDSTFAAYARAACVGQPNCTLTSQGDPCGGVIKAIAAVAHCSTGGGYSPLPPPPSPTCALNGLPCAPPTWEPTWNLTQSTVIQPSGSTFFQPQHPWGLISLDWSVASSEWYKGNVSNTTCEQTSVTGCRMLKAAGLATRCFIYHNMELGLEFLESQRAVMYDDAYSGFFLRQGGVPGAPAYNEPISFGSQFFWDFRNETARQYFVAATLATLADPAVDGTFTDDVDGMPAEHPNAPAGCGLSPAQLQDLRYATQEASSELIQAATSAGKYNWQAFGASDGVNPGPSSGSCAAWMAAQCDPAMQGRPMMLAMDNSPANANQTVAAFLIARPPYAYVGWGWESDDRQWNDLFWLQVGVPQGLCSEGAPGVFSRAYSAGTATLDCNTWAAELPFPALAH